jgi:hypothetical protein
MALVEMLRVFGFALWLSLAVLGAWLLLTGRHVVFGLPMGVRDGWPMRLFGLVYFLAGTFISYRVIQGSFSPEGIVFGYVSLVALVLIAWWKARTQGDVTPSIK